MDIDDGIRCALDGEAVLFIGAGLSFLATNQENNALPDGSKLCDLLLEQPMGTGSKHPLDRIAGHVIKSKGVEFVYDLLKRSLSVKAVDDRLLQLYDLPWRRIYTSNYDDAIEFSINGRRPISRASLDDDISQARPGSIIHLNGFIGDVGPSSLNQGLILTDYSYATSRLISSEWLKFFVRDMRSSRAIIFAGYSLSDLDIARALIQDESLVRKTFFFISPTADALEQGTLASFGSVEPGGIDALGNRLKAVSADYTAVRFAPAYLALAEVKAHKSSANEISNARRLTEQLVFGRLPEREVVLGEKVFGNHPYLVFRHHDKEVVEAIRLGPWRDVLITGELASGKSASALNITSFFIDEGYKAFYASKGVTLSEELRKIAGRKEKILIVFENYASMMTEIRDYVARRPQEHRIILTERSVAHGLVSDFIDKTAHLGPTFESDLDRIHTADLASFEALVNFGGFWGERAASSEQARQSYIKNNLSSSLYKLLIEIIESKKVQADIQTLLAPLSKDRNALKLFVSAFIINVLGFKFSINEWQSVFDAQWVRKTMRAYAAQMRNFLEIDGDAIFPRAGVLSAYLLRTFADDEVVRGSLVDLYERACRGETSDPELLSLRIALTKYGSIEPVFSEKSKANNIFRYYDDIRVFGHTRNNPDYWLQLGIAATVYDDLERASVAFENAYARERSKPRPNLKKIDNYFSRFEMRKSVEENDPRQAFITFTKANERLKKQMFLEENRHYPYKTGRYYTDIAAKHYKYWNESQKDRFERETKEIRERAINWRNTHREHSFDVEVLIRETTLLLESLDRPA